MDDQHWSRRGVVTAGGSIVASVALGGCFFAQQGEQSDVAPSATFTFDYGGGEGSSSGGASTLTISHGSGDSFDPQELFVRGDGFADVEGVDMTEPGSWAGQASGSLDGSSAVVSGDTVTVGATDDFEIQIVWEATDPDGTAILDEGSGPTA